MDKTRLLISSGRGPAECRLGVQHVHDTLQRQANETGIDIDNLTTADKIGFFSALVTLHGPAANTVAKWLALRTTRAGGVLS